VVSILLGTEPLGCLVGYIRNIGLSYWKNKDKKQPVSLSGLVIYWTGRT